MGMTITEKILAAHAQEEHLEPGQLIMARVDVALGNDITAPISIAEFKKAGAGRVFDRDRVILVADHFTPSKDIKAAENVKVLREFAREQELTHFFESGSSGIEHALLPEQGLVHPGELIIGADSHTCTYGALGAFATGVGSTDLAAGMITGELWFKVPQSVKFIFRGKLMPWVSGKDLILYTIGKIGVDGARYEAMEFEGEVIESLPMDDRLTICNMAVEAGAKNGIIPPDDITLEYMKGRSLREFKLYRSDPDASYRRVFEFDGAEIEPQVAFPHLPENVRPVGEAAHVTIDQAVIGSCTNGRLSDLRVAARILKGRRVNSNVRLILIPATPTIYHEALKEGLIEAFLEAGGVVCPPTCGPCIGGHMGVLAEGERAVSTTNRNFVGRMGHPKSEVYLASPAVAAASAVMGRLAHPEEVR